MQDHRTQGSGLLAAGAGLGLGLLQLTVLIPGFFPSFALLMVAAVVIAVPLLALGLAMCLLAAPPVAVWWLWSRHRSLRDADPCVPAPHA